MSALLLYGDTETSASMRHEVPIAVGDPFLLAQDGQRTWIMCSGLERDRMARLRPDAELLATDDLGFHELLESGLSRDQLMLELASRAAARTQISEAIVEFEFPLGLAERLRADGIELTIDDDAVKARRRAKSRAELAGVRRAQRAAEAAMTAAAGLLSEAEVAGDTLVLEAEPLTAERVRAAMRDACWQRGALLGPEAIVASVWQGFGHDPGSGPLPAGLPIQVDVWPRDDESACWADMTRTFIVGPAPPDEVVRQQELVREALDGARAAARPGITGRELHAGCCEIFERAGYRTQRTGPGEDRNEGFQFSLGHGVGLQVHEAPALGQTGRSPLVVGDVIAVEPGLWQRDVGGVRLEDLLLITDDGCEVLTEFPYDTRPS
ncbi:MAG TPA: M24 family metallopeptidase [Solirubrobacteraceae bacterium]|jgi:Xaa-Pro aminopeptidase